MIRAARLRRWLGRALRREDGTATVEFVIVFPLFIGILASSIEAGIFMARQVMLERALDLSVRELRLGVMEDPTHATLRDRICAQTTVIPECEGSLLLELRAVNTQTWSGLDDPVTCIDRADDVAPPVTFNPGSDNEMMVVRACVIADPLFPFTGLGMALPKDSTGGYRISSVSAFVNEPR